MKRKYSEHAIYVRKLNIRLKALQSNQRIRIKYDKIHANSIFLRAMFNAIYQLALQVKKFQAIKAQWIYDRLDYMMLEIHTTSDLLGCYDEYVKICRDWREIQKSL